MAATRSLFLLILILLSTSVGSSSLQHPSLCYLFFFPFLFPSSFQNSNKERSQAKNLPKRRKRKDVKVAAFEEGISDELIISDQKLMLGSDCSDFEDSNLFRSSQSSENSISNDESLIEVALPDGHYLGSGKTSSEFEVELLITCMTSPWAPSNA